MTSIIVVFIGIPVYLLLRRFNKATTLNLAIVGVVIPGVVYTIIDFITGTSGSFGHTYHGTYRQMIVDGERTFWGWLSIFEQGIIFCIYGAVAAATFGLVVGHKYSD